MNKWILLLLAVLNVIVCFYAIAPQYVTFAEVYPENITYISNDEVSIERAIIQTRHEAIEFGREYFGSSSFILAGLVAVNFMTLLFMTLKNHKDLDSDNT